MQQHFLSGLQSEYSINKTIVLSDSTPSLQYYINGKL